MFLGDYIDRGPDSAGVVAWVRELHGEIAREGRSRCAATTRTPGCRSSTRAGRSSCSRAATAASSAIARSSAGRAARRGRAADRRGVRGDVRGAVPAARRRRVDARRCRSSTRTSTRSTSTPGSSARAMASRIRPRSSRRRALLWLRDRDFFENYRGKLVVFGHTTTRTLPNELSTLHARRPDGPVGRPRVHRARHRVRQGRIPDRVRAAREASLRIAWLTRSPPIHGIAARRCGFGARSPRRSACSSRCRCSSSRSASASCSSVAMRRARHRMSMARHQLAEQANSVQADVAFALDQADPLIDSAARARRSRRVRSRTCCRACTI